MGCSTCGSGCSPEGCGNKGSCASGGCNMRNTYDWLSPLEAYDPSGTDLVEVTFRNGARKGFYRLRVMNEYHTGDIVVVDSHSGYDMGRISLSGALVPLQMRKKKIKEENIQLEVIRKANHRDIERLKEARSREKSILVRARAIAYAHKLDMKIGDIQFQGDGRKATFYYTANGRIDFRELVRQYAREFKIKVEMRQIGARQESARIGGIGSCGRELCCSTWLSDFKSVSTGAARYQNISINQTKLTGQCGRLKCCLNYELDTYIEALKDFPKSVNTLHTELGKAHLVKTDIFKGLMFYAYADANRPGMIELTKERVREIKKINLAGNRPEELIDKHAIEEEIKLDYEDVTGVIELPMEKRRKNRRNPNRAKNKSRSGGRKSESRSSKSVDRDGNRAKKSGSKRRRPDKKKGADGKSPPSAHKKGKNPSSNQNKRSNNRPDRRDKK